MTVALEIWKRWCAAQAIADDGVPLFDSRDDGFVAIKVVGRSKIRRILQRHPLMEALILRETEILVADWQSKQHKYDGIIYMMFTKGAGGEVIPLYIGKAESFGKSNGNLSANITNLQRDRYKFARWGDGYAYHIGDLSAATLQGHASNRVNPKYVEWASRLFEINHEQDPRLRCPVFFWAKAWKPTDVGVWNELSPTRLSFLEYLLIGVASTAFGDELLNYEGRNRGVSL